MTSQHSFDLRPLPVVGGPSAPLAMAYARWLMAGGRSRSTVYLRLTYLRRLTRAYPNRDLLELNAGDLVGFLAREDWSPETRKSARAAVRGFYSWALDDERIMVDPSRRLATVPVPAGQPRPAPDDVVMAALGAAVGADRLMLLLAAYAGLRISEIARVHTDDLLGDVLRVTGKGGRVRHVPIHPVLHAELLMLPPGWAIPGGYGRHERSGDHITATNVGKRLKALLGGQQWTAHTLRHRFASKCYSAERDIRAVQVLLGHSKVETTQRYTAIPDGALRAAVLAVE